MDNPSTWQSDTSLVSEALAAMNFYLEEEYTRIKEYNRIVIDGGIHGLECILLRRIHGSIWLPVASSQVCYLWNQPKRLWLTNVHVATLARWCSRYLEEVLRFLNIASPGDKELQKLLKQAQRAGFARGIFKTLAYQYLVHDKFAARLDRDDPDVLPIKGGRMIDLRNGTTYERTREHLWTVEAPFNILPDHVELPNIEKFMNEITCGDKKLKRTLQLSLGYCLTGRTSSRCFFLLIGRGANGKSSLYALLKAVLPGRLASVLSRDVITRAPRATAGAPNPQLAPLQYARVANVSETNEGEMLNEGMVKLLTGDGASIDVRLPNAARSATIEPRAKLLIDSNFPLSFNVNDRAILDRVIVIPLNARFVDNPSARNEYYRDPHIVNRLIGFHGDELLTWLVRGARQWYAEGERIPLCEVCQIAKQRYKELQDPAALFYRCLVNDVPRDWSISYLLSDRDLMQGFDRFCASEGLAPRTAAQHKVMLQRLCEQRHPSCKENRYFLRWASTG